MTAEALTEERRAELQRRTLRTLTVGQVVGSASMSSAVTVGAYVIQEILGQKTPWGGIATATVTMGGAVMSQVLSRMMMRRGRRPGMQVGYGLATCGAVAAGIGAETSTLVVFLAGLFLFGSGQASNLLARYAATDLALPADRSRAMSRIVFASTFGAVFGPLLIGPAQWAGENAFGWHRYTGPWLFASCVLLVAFTNVSLRLRPDPLVLSGGVRSSVDEKLPSIPAALRIVTATSRGRLALGSMVVSQAAMVAIMTMTPVHMKLHGHETLSQYVVSLHIAGMYAFSPLVGRYTADKGTLASVRLGAAILVAATVASSLSGNGPVMVFPALWLLGIGWNFGLIGGSTMLLESVPDSERVTVQGSADLMMSLCGGIAGLSSGFIRRAVGYHVLSVMGLVAVGLLTVGAYWLLVTERRVVAAP